LTKTRLPPTWLVLVPALALAAVGARAVMAEMRASQDAARDRARSVASRLARSVDALVAEYGIHPPTGTTAAEIEAAVAHLTPHAAVPLKATPDEIRDQGASAASRELPRRERWPDRLEDEAEVKLVRDALQTAERLSSESQGSIGAAALLVGTEAAVRGRGALVKLRCSRARFESAVGDVDAAAKTLADLWRFAPLLVDADGLMYPEAALQLEGRRLALIDDRAPPLQLQGRPLDNVAVPTWVREAYEACARRPSETSSMDLDRVESLFGRRIPLELLRLRRLCDDAKFVADTRVSRGPVDLEPTDAGLLRITMWFEDSRSGLLLCGDVPPTVVEDRLGVEARALAREDGVVSIRLVEPLGGHAIETSGDAAGGEQLVVETANLASPLWVWRVETIVNSDSVVPATAWLLAGAVVVMTAALLWGALALRRAAERSARLAEERRTFLDHVAHELRTPSAAVLALTEELASGHVAPEREPEYRKHLLRESRRLAGLVDDTLDFARLDAGRLAFTMEPADLRDVVRQAIEESDGAGRVVAKFPDAPVVRDVDAAALRRAVKNLVENAVRHGGGDAAVDVALEAVNGHASIVVADRGRGIAAEHLPRIFERFYRVPSATHETKGVGLGLALCREIARAHGGDVAVASEVGKGSTFTLRVPLT
jgi:signal transduction histidine kinase